MSEIRSVINTSLRYALFYNKNTSVIPYEIYDLIDIIVIFAWSALQFQVEVIEQNALL